MIVTVTANAAIDRTLFVPTLGGSRRQRVADDSSQAGGKGVNVARVLQALGHAAHAVVVVGGQDGAWILRDLEAAGLPATPVWADGESRTCLEIVESTTGRVTQLHGPGVCAGPETAEALFTRSEEKLATAEWLVLCGSLARGLCDDTYALLVKRARARGVRTAVDTSGPALGAAWASQPDLLRINRTEAAEVLGPSVAALASGAGLGPVRPAIAVLSDGPGQILCSCADGRGWTLEPPRVSARNTIGCGDAMMAGLLAGLVEGRSLEATLRAATALAAAEAESPIAGRPDPTRGRALEPHVRLVESRPTAPTT